MTHMHTYLPCDVVNEFLSYFQVCLAADLDLELNQGKSEIWLPSGTLDDGIAPEITKRNQGGIVSRYAGHQWGRQHSSGHT